MNAKLYLSLPHLLGREFTEEVNFNEAVLGKPTEECAFALRLLCCPGDAGEPMTLPALPLSILPTPPSVLSNC